MSTLSLSSESGSGVYQDLIQVLQDYAYEAKDIIKHELVNNDKVASGALLSSIETEVITGDGEYKVVLHAEDYLKYIEQGRQQGGKFPPIDAIKEWIEIKPVLPRPFDNGKLPTTDQLAFLIARSIAENGIKPTPILSETVEELNAKYEPLINEALRGIAIAVITDGLNDFISGSTDYPNT